jgi:hypothetical protein
MLKPELCNFFSWIDFSKSNLTNNSLICKRIEFALKIGIGKN